MRATGLHFVLVPFLGIFFLLTSCRYSDNVSLGIDFTNNVSDYSDSSKSAFISSQKAYRSAEGLAAFPDGGQSKYVYKAKGLYVYDSGKDELTLLKDLTKTTKPPWHVRLRLSLVFKDDLVYYMCKLDTLKPIDSVEFVSIKNEFAECIVININTKETRPIDTATFNDIFNNYKTPGKGIFSKLKEQTPLAEWGLILKDIYPKSDETYIDYFISWKNGGNNLTRRAIYEQIIANKSKDEIRDILKRMEEYRDGLDVYDKSSYEFWMRDDYERLRALL